MKNKLISAISSVMLLFNVIYPSCNIVGAQGLLVSYEFSGYESEIPGYAEGKVTISVGNKTGYCILFWADDNEILNGYEKITSIKIDSNETVEYNMPENMAIPDGATRLAVFFAETENYTPQGISDAIFYEIPKNKQFDSGNLEMAFASVSDIHVNYNSSDPNSDNYCGAPYKWTQALNYFAELNLDMVNISGDCTSYGGASEYDVYTQSIKNSKYDPAKIYMERGNHDSQENDNFINYTSREDMVRPFEKSPWFYVLKKGDEGEKDNLFIYLAQELTSISNTNLQDNFSSAQLDWLENLLRTYAGTNTNIFILEHAFYHNWGPGDRYNGIYVQPMMINDSYVGNMRLQRLLMEYKEAVFMTGHSHIAFSEMVNYSDENNTACRMIHNSSTSQQRVYNPDGKSIRYRAEGVDNVSGSEGYVVGVYAKDIVYNGTNLTSKERIPTACYIFPSYVENRSEVTDISITVPPKKTVYNEGEYFNAAGMVVTAAYSDGTTKNVQGWGIGDNTSLSKGDTAVTIKYGDNLKATVPIKVRTMENGFSGSGTKDDPYLIQNEDDFAFLTKCFESKTGSSSNDENTFGKGMFFMQTADLDMTKCPDYKGTGASGSAKYGYSGVYNGGGHNIKVNISTSETDLSVFPYVNGVVMNVNFSGNISASTYAQPIRTVGSNGKIINCSSKMILTAGTANGLSLSNYGTVIRYFSNCEFGSSGTKRVYSNTTQGTTVYMDCMYDGAVSDSNGSKVINYTSSANKMNSRPNVAIDKAVEILTQYDTGYSAKDINIWKNDMSVAVTEQSSIAPLTIIKSDILKPVEGEDYTVSKVISNYSDKNIEIHYAIGALLDNDGKLSKTKSQKIIIQPNETKEITFEFGSIADNAKKASIYLWNENLQPYFIAE